MMSSETTSAPREKRSIGGDLVIPVAALFFTLYYFLTIIDSPWTAQVSAFFIGESMIVEKTKAPWEFIKYGSPEDCAKYVKDITEIGEQYLMNSPGALVLTTASL